MTRAIADQLATLLAHPEQAEDLTPAEARALLLQASALVLALAARTGDSPNGNREDRLLTVAEATKRLSVSPDWLYRHAKALPFTVRGPCGLRFSSHGIDRYIRQRQGR